MKNTNKVVRTICICQQFVFISLPSVLLGVTSFKKCKTLFRPKVIRTICSRQTFIFISFAESIGQFKLGGRPLTGPILLFLHTFCHKVPTLDISGHPLGLTLTPPHGKSWIRP